MISLMDTSEFLQSGQITNLLPRLGPCISIYLPVTLKDDRHSTLNTRVLRALRKAELLLSDAESDSTVRLPSADLWQYAKHLKPISPQGSIAIFDTPGYTDVVRMNAPLRESVHCGGDFYILPLLTGMQRDQQFHLLALSEKQVRLFRCTSRSVDELPLPSTLPRSLLQTGQFSPPDHMLENRSAAGQTPGQRRRIHFTTGTEELKHDAHLRKFFTAIDSAIQPLLKRSASPLMLATVRREAALYKEVSTYAPLIDEVAEGSPDDLSPQDLLRRAANTWEKHLDAEQQAVWLEALAATEAGRTTQDPLQLLHAADHGFIHKLLLPSVEQGEATDDLVNHLALETLRHGGQVVVMTQENPPIASPLAIVRHKSALHTADLNSLQSMR